MRKARAFGGEKASSLELTAWHGAFEGRYQNLLKSTAMQRAPKNHVEAPRLRSSARRLSGPSPACRVLRVPSPRQQPRRRGQGGLAQWGSRAALLR